MQQLFLLHTITFCKLILFPVIHIYLLVRFITGNLRALGSFVALAIGDAMGAPLEGSAKAESWVTEMLPGGRHSRKKGQITDDTLQAMAVAESLTACGGFDQNDLISRLLRSYQTSPEWYGPLPLLSLNWSNPAPCRTRLHGSCTNDCTAAVPTGV